MSHEITKTDTVVTQGAAWHGLSVEKPSLFPVREGMRLALPWEAEVSPETLAFTYPDGRTTMTDTRCIRRSDNGDCIGVCGQKTHLFGNRQVEEFADTVEGITGWRCSSVGSIFGGKKTFVTLAAGTEEDLGKGDTVRPYLTILNGFDGTTPLSVYRAALRVVCYNTFRATLTGGGNLLRARHTESLTIKVDAVIEAIRRGDTEAAAGREKVKALQTKQLNRDAIRNLWADIVAREYGGMVQNPANGHDERRNARCAAFLAYCAETFDAESPKYGANAWIAVNAATKALQNLRAADIRTDDGRTNALIRGSLDEACAEAFSDALALC